MPLYLHVYMRAFYSRDGNAGVVSALADYGVSINVINKFGDSPLHVACSKGKLILYTLLKKRYPTGIYVSRGALVEAYAPCQVWDPNHPFTC